MPTINKIIFDDKIPLSRNNLEEISGNLVFLSTNKKRVKPVPKIDKKNSDAIGTLEINSSWLMPKLSVLRKVMNNRNDIMLMPNKIEPFRSNFLPELSFFWPEISVTFFSTSAINLIIIKIRHIFIGIIEKNVTLQP